MDKETDIYVHSAEYFEKKLKEKILKAQETFGKEAYKRYVEYSKKQAKKIGYTFCGVRD